MFEGNFIRERIQQSKASRSRPFFNENYLPTLTKYKYHRWLKIMLSKKNIEDVRKSRVQPGEAAGSRDYAERLLLKFHKEIQSEHFGQGRDLSIEGNLVTYYEEDACETCEVRA